MSSGRLQLASVGIQDEFLTGSPDVTYFLKRFKRHTKFAIELIDNGLDGTLDFGGRVRCLVPHKGDLIRNIYVRFELPELTHSEAPYNVGYTDSVGHAIIEYADLLIGGQTIQRITGEFMEIYSEFFIGNSQQKAYTMLTGKTGTRTGLGPATTDPSVANSFAGAYPRTFMVSIPFYFHRHDSLSIPLCALEKHEVEVVLKLRPLDQLVVQPTGSTIIDATVPQGKLVHVSMPIEYVFLTDDEKNYIKTRPIDYVMTQLQLSTFKFEPDVTYKQLLTQFTNPVKELFIVIQNDDVVQSNTQTGNDWFNYKNPENEVFPKTEQLHDLELTFNGEVRISRDVASAVFMRYLHPIQFHTRVATDRLIYNYSFALDPENHVPTGQVNMSRIQYKVLKINTTSNTKSRTARVYAVNYNILRIHNGLAGLLFTDNSLS